MPYRLFTVAILLCVLPVFVHAKTLLVLGDSLSAAYGIPVERGWVSLLAQRIIKHKLDYNVVNASISGETTVGARRRLPKLLDEIRPGVVIVELGGNDGLRGFPLDEIERNLTAIIAMIRQAGGYVLLVPMRLPSNYGAAYNQRFSAIYDRLAVPLNVNLSTFILHNIAQYPELMQDDGIHPVADAQSVMLENIWPALLNLMQQTENR